MSLPPTIAEFKTLNLACLFALAVFIPTPKVPEALVRLIPIVLLLPPPIKLLSPDIRFSSPPPITDCSKDISAS